MLENMTPPKKRPAMVGSIAKIECQKTEYRGTILEINPTYLMFEVTDKTVVLVPWTDIRSVVVDVATV